MVLGLLSIPSTNLMASSTPALTLNQTDAVMGIITNFILDDEGVSDIAQLAIEKIKAYATSNGASTPPTIQDYTNAGVIGINNSNVADMNEIIRNLSALEVDTKEELQVLADALGVTLPKKVVSFHNVPVITDGTIEGTKYLVDPYNNPNYMRPYTSANNELSTYTVGDTIYFFAIDDVHGSELWKTNGTPSGTVIVKDIYTGSISINSSIGVPRLVGIGNHVYFASRNNNFSNFIFRSDGTDAGTIPIIQGSSNAQMIATNDMLYFAHKEEDTGLEPWISDGTNRGNIIKNISFYSQPTSMKDPSSNPRYFTSFKDKVYFHASYRDTTDNSIYNYALWSTDVNINRTLHILDMSIIDGKMVECGEFLYFPGNKTSNDEKKLWKSDGTAMGTTSINVTAGKINSNPKLTCVNDSIYFLGKDSNNRSGLWKSNGTSSTTYFVKKIDGIADMKPVGNKLIIISLTEVWVSDGTFNGTVKLDILSNGIYSITPLTDKRVLISSYSELWVTDGTLAGSQKLLERP